jgi:hypothetical protein
MTMDAALGQVGDSKLPQMARNETSDLRPTTNWSKGCEVLADSPIIVPAQ